MAETRQAPPGPTYGASQRPGARLRSLLQLERSDVQIVVLLAAVVGVLSLTVPLAVELLVNTVAQTLIQQVIVLATILLIILAIVAGIRALVTYVTEVLQRRLFVRSLGSFTDRLTHADLEQLNGAHFPELVNRFFDVVTAQKAIAFLLVDGITIALTTIVGMIVLAFYHPWLLGYDLLLVGMMVFALFVLGRGAIGTAVKESKSKYRAAAWLEEIARCAASFKHAGGDGFSKHVSNELAAQYLDYRRDHFRILFRQVVFSLVMEAFAASVLIGIGAVLVLRGQLNLGQLVAAELIVTVIISSFAKLGKHLETFYDLLAALDKLGVVMDLPSEPPAGTRVMPGDGPVSIRCHSLSYRYPGALRPVIYELSVSLRAGASLAVTGPAGCGKSTLAEVLFGLRTPESGHVELDGVEIRSLQREELRRCIGLVSSVDMIEGTISENIRFGRDDVTADEVAEALQIVELSDEILDLPRVTETMLSGSGAPLSESQRIRVALARAIAGRPRLLVIDGLLDRLPSVTTSAIIDKLTRPGAPWTLVITSARDDILQRLDHTLRLSRPTATEFEQSTEAPR